MKVHLLILFFMVSITGAAQASLGETEQQLIARYGPETSKFTGIASGKGVTLDRLTFHKNNFTINVVLFKGISSEESVSKEPYAPITDEEVKALLEANGKGHTWKTVEPQHEALLWSKSSKSWQRDDDVIANLGGTKEKPASLFHIKSRELISAQKAAANVE